ncbi:uncharacterized protein C4orf45 homolog [Monodelphis domestica]|uniref:uncharacterized protein C4orf45 homolog n=1 Tax=Monodelphis domestica TaxID=13616 RepID=UPI00028BDCC0|nr:uncharacterized protein C4orf45 homolog [Monodelphis domestica]
MADSLSYRDPISSSVGRRMIFTGPEAKKDYKPKIPLYTKYIGEKSPVLETTTELDYLWRPAPNKNFIAREKHFYVGEIGWGIPALSYTNDSRLQTGWNKKQGEFHKAAEDLLSHRYQNPWYPNPQILDLQGASRSYLAWNIGDHENISERHSKWANIVRNLKSMRYSNCSSISKVDQKIAFSQGLSTSPSHSESQEQYHQSAVEDSQIQKSNSAQTEPVSGKENATKTP